MKIKELLRLYKDEPNFVKKELLSFLSGIKFDEIYANLEAEFEREHEFEGLMQSYKMGMPVAYLTNRAYFLDNEFFVNDSVLIPRAETEILATAVIDAACEMKNPKICEIGTGSGIIAISLKLALPNAQITATDISNSALNIARKNAAKFGTEIEFYKTNLMDGIEGNFDIIVSNPPYIKNSYDLDIWVQKEPNLALFGGIKGDEILKKIIEISSERTKILACEIGYDQMEVLNKFLFDFGFNARFYKDLAGFDRGFIAFKDEK